ncbi:MAG: P-II family nitrogen regulator [Chloroflexi bacterium]|nr:P-II family nitrogen regulator [Chloroflexota bacterium]MDA1175398.1 P-II family nitrogen regulator [Chloroflexota bacterium]
MISIEAIVRPERVSQVTAALVEAGCPGFYYYNITGQGRQHGVEVFVGRGGAMATRSTVPKTLIRTVINEDQKDAIVAAIVASAKGPGEGDIGDGKIFVSQIEDAVRVRTGDHGAAAI